MIIIKYTLVVVKYTLGFVYIGVTSEIGTAWELRTATSIPRPIQYTEMDLRNKTTSKFRIVFTGPWVSLIVRFRCIWKANQILNVVK